MHIFEELEEFRAFELLRSGLDRSKYLLVKEAKIIAMTCTHAALKRSELVQMGESIHNTNLQNAKMSLSVGSVNTGDLLNRSTSNLAQNL